MATSTLRLTIDEDWLRLMAYREVLREIVREADEDGEAWKVDPNVEAARRILAHFGDLP